MQSALFITCFVCALGGVFFLLTAVFIEADRTRTERITHGQTHTQKEFITSAPGGMRAIVVNMLHHVHIAESEPYCHSILFVCLSVIPRPTAYHD